MYKAQIEFTAHEDSWAEGELIEVANNWDETLTADTASELRNKILESTYSKWEDLDSEQINEYDWCTEYSTSYMANESNEGSASESELEAWKAGKLKLWAIHCHILVTEVTETKASL